MAQRCKVCTHPKRDEINRNLMQPDASPSKVAQLYGLVPQSVNRHLRNHLVLSPQAAHDAKNALTVVGYAADLYERAVGVLKRAEQALDDSEGDSRSLQAAAATLREVRGSIELLAKLVVTEPETAAANERNAWLDEQLAEALAALSPPELPAGPALPSGIEDAEVVAD